jgi:hypothetical protein
MPEFGVLGVFKRTLIAPAFLMGSRQQVSMAAQQLNSVKL